MKLKKQINHYIADALANASIDIESVKVTEATKPEFGDYQFNGIMPLAKPLKRNPREIAAEVAGFIDTKGLISRVEVAGPGFINIWLDDGWLGEERARSSPIHVLVLKRGLILSKLSSTTPAPIWQSRCM